MWLWLPNINLVRKSYTSLKAVNTVRSSWFSFLGWLEEVFKIQKDLNIFKNLRSNIFSHSTFYKDFESQGLYILFLISNMVIQYHTF